MKCDEEKPECKRCTSTGRKCDGYAEVQPRRHKRPDDGPPSPNHSNEPTDSADDDIVVLDGFSTSPELQLTPFQATYRERRALDFFYTESAPQLAGSFSSHFWNGCLLQLSISEPAIRYAMVALGTMLEAEMSPSPEEYVVPFLSDQAGVISSTFSIASSTFSTRLGPSREQFAIHYYNKAIQSVVGRSDGDSRSLSIIAMTCIMFICVEFLRGNVDAALTHINSGVKMIKGFRAELDQGQIIMRSVGSSFEAAFIEKEIVPMMSWLSIVGAVFGKPSGEIFQHPFNGGQDFVIQETPRTMHEARAIAADVTNATIRLLTAAANGKYGGTVSVEHLTEHTKLTNLMRQLEIDTENILSQLDVSKDRTLAIKADHLRLTILSGKVWLGSALSPYECSWDDSYDDFVKIVDIAERSIANSLPSFKRHTKHFSFEAGIVPALHVTAWKCRHPILRRRAAELLFAWPRRECLFDSRHFYGVFLKLIRLEERNGTWANLSEAEIDLILKYDTLTRSRSIPNISTMMLDMDVGSFLEDLLDDLDVSATQSTDPPIIPGWQPGAQSIKEGFLNEIPFIPDTNMVLAAPEADRVHHFMLSADHVSLPLMKEFPATDARPFPRTRWDEMPIGSDARFHAITFLTKPDGLMGPWRRYDEHIDLSLFERMAGSRLHIVQSTQCADGDTMLLPSKQDLEEVTWPKNNGAWGLHSHDAPWGYRGMMQ